MIEAWTNFGAMLFVQLFLFFGLAHFEKKVPETLPLLGRGVLIGIVVGLFFDLVVGKLLGLHAYVLGFGPFFLGTNIVLSYGIFSATILLFRQSRLLHFCIAVIAIVVVYEIANHFFPVWTWQFAGPPLQSFTVLTLGYLGGAGLVVILERVLRFTRLPKLPTL